MCDFKNLCPHIICKNDSKKFKGIYTLKDCISDSSTHLVSLNLLSLNVESYPTENQLILNRAGLPNIENLQSLKICAHHRAELGLFYRARKKCESTDHKNESRAKYKTISFAKSNFMQIENNKEFYAKMLTGDALCQNCFKIINLKLNNQEEINDQNENDLNNNNLNQQKSKKTN
jgi:hypothetical protein